MSKRNNPIDLSQKLETPYHLSQAAQGALRDQAIERAAREALLAPADKRLSVPDVVNTTDQAEEVARNLSAINAAKRAEAAQRNSQWPR